MELEVIGEKLEKVYDGSGDVVVGISGFGSLKNDPQLWEFLGPFTGRTAYVLRYDAQEIPFGISSDALLNLSNAWEHYGEMKQRWICAKLAGAAAIEFLKDCIEEWLSEGRKVIIVGFSLGGWVAWNACKGIPSQDLQCVLLSAAVSNEPTTWIDEEVGFEAGDLGALVNVYSSNDRVLRSLYPHAEPTDSSAAGLSPLKCNAAINIDMTDLIGADHSRGSASYGAYRLFRCAMCHLHLNNDIEGVLDSFGEIEGDVPFLPLAIYERLSRWVLIDLALWELLGKAMQGDKRSIELCIRLDAWSFSYDRLSYLLDVGMAALAIYHSPTQIKATARSYNEIAGLMRSWLDRSLNGIDLDAELPKTYESSPEEVVAWEAIEVGV